MKTFAPVVLFCYKRLDTLAQTIEVLQQNYLALENDLFIFSDGPKKDVDKTAIAEIRNLKKITIVEAEKNKGLAVSIIGGVTDIINKYYPTLVKNRSIQEAVNRIVSDMTGLLSNQRKGKINSWAIRRRYPVRNFLPG
jgi:hypothetical protein